jgi:hypothetical protein
VFHGITTVRWEGRRPSVDGRSSVANRSRGS